MVSRINRNTKSRTTILPCPVGGMNTKDSRASLSDKYAEKLVNWFPTTSDLGVRKGFRQWSTEIDGQVNSLMAYLGIDKQLFGVAGSNIYNVTSSGIVGVPVVTGLSNDKFIYANITTSGGSFLVAVNGVDDLQLYNGTTWTSINGSSTPAITGVITSNLTYVTLAKRRLWFVEKESTKAWYLPVNSVGGTVSDLELGASFNIKGGYLKAISSWSISGGFGVQDLTAFISTEGDIAVYAGDDPDDATTWKLVGTYNLGSPVGNMPFARLGTDLLVLTQKGLNSLSQGQFFADVSQDKPSLTNKIQPDINRSTTTYQLNHGWQVLAYPNENMLIVNVPVAIGQQIQYVMNTITGAWAEFNQIYANCFCLFNEIMYFGGNSGVYQFWQNNSDNNSQINAECITAFSTFKTANKKAFKMVRPTITTYKSNQLTVGMEINYKISNDLSTPTIPNNSDSEWDSSQWDSAVWGSEELQSDWINVQGIGFSGALHLKVACREAFRWASTEYMYIIGSAF